MSEEDPKALKKLPPGMATADQIAQVCGCTSTYVRQLSREGVIPKAQRGAYPFIPALKGYIEFLRNENRRSSKAAADSRVRDARADEIQLKIAERRRELIPADDAVAAMSNVCGFIRQSMDGVPARITRDLELRRKIEKEIDDALVQAAGRCGAVEAALRDGLDPAEADHKGRA